MTAALNGFVLGATLIIAIGAQNAFVLRLGLVGRHVFAVCLVCALADAILIAAGVAGLGAVVDANPALLRAVTGGGALFLLLYALFAFGRAWGGASMAVREGEGGTLGAAIATALALTFLNPHVYLDTVVLLGGLSTRFEGAERALYGAGAMAASFAWFFSLGYGARLLVPLFARPNAWRALDIAIGVVMALLGLRLLAAFLSPAA